MPIPNQGTVSMFDRAVCFQIAGRCRWCGQLRLGAESSQCWTEIMMTHDLYQRPLASKTFWVRALWRPEAVYQTPFNFPPQAWNTTFCVKVLVRWVCLKFTFSCARLLPRTRTKQFWSVRDFLQKWNWKLRDSCKKWSLWCGVGCCSYRSFSTQNSKPSFDILWERERRKRMLDKTWSSPWQHVGHQKSIDMFAPLWLCDYMWLHVIFFMIFSNCNEKTWGLWNVLRSSKIAWREVRLGTCRSVSGSACSARSLGENRRQNNRWICLVVFELLSLLTSTSEILKISNKTCQQRGILEHANIWSKKRRRLWMQMFLCTLCKSVYSQSNYIFVLFVLL